MPAKFIVCFVTAPGADSAAAIAERLVEQRLAACVNIIPAVQSTYIWEGKICKDPESLLIIKTRASLFKRLEAEIKKVHPYKVPEVIALPIISGSRSYLDWVDNVTSGNSKKAKAVKS